MEATENMLRAKVNSALGKLETFIQSYEDFHQQPGDVKYYFQAAQGLAKNVADTLAPYNHSISARKALIRSWVMNQRTAGKLPTPPARGRDQKPDLSISLEDWTKGLEAVKITFKNKWAEEAEDFYGRILSLDLSKDDVVTVPESLIYERLRTTFSGRF
jgi:hypothetical protein